jgi:hypothetical protein
MSYYDSALYDTGRYEWKETAPGQWMRPLDSIEKIFYSVSSLSASTVVTHMMVTVGAQLPLLPGVIDHVIKNASLAWKSLRFNHPRTACTVEDGKLRYQVLSEEGL